MLKACVNFHQLINFNVFIVICLLGVLVIPDSTIINFLCFNPIPWFISNIGEAIVKQPASDMPCLLKCTWSYYSTGVSLLKLSYHK